MRRSYRFALIAGAVAIAAAVTPRSEVASPGTRGALEGREPARRESLQGLAVPAEGAQARPFARPTGRSRPREGSGGPSREEDRPARGPAVVSAAEGEVGLHWIGLFEAAEQPLLSVAGIDFRAPRDLTLWKLDEFRRQATPVTKLRSQVGRPFLAEHLLLSARGARLVLAPHGADPFGLQASTILEVPPQTAARRRSP
jgi:hypothetical protein